MTTCIGFVVAVLLGVCLFVIATFMVVGVAVTSSTVRASRADQALREDLDRALDEILGTGTSEPTPRR